VGRVVAPPSFYLFFCLKMAFLDGSCLLQCISLDSLPCTRSSKTTFLVLVSFLDSCHAQEPFPPHPSPKCQIITTFASKHAQVQIQLSEAEFHPHNSLFTAVYCISSNTWQCFLFINFLVGGVSIGAVILSFKSSPPLRADFTWRSPLDILQC
jgi:hypothetical protein